MRTPTGLWRKRSCGYLASFFGVIVALHSAQAGLVEKKRSEKPKRQADVILKLGVPVPYSRCQSAPYQCTCPHNSRGIQFRSGRMPTQYVCVNSVCESGQVLRIRTTRRGDSKEGICEGESK